MIKVKICGITNIEDAQAASHLGADALGFIFSKKSPRCIGKDAAKKIIQQLDPFLTTVGVFVDEAKQVVDDIAGTLGLDALQFHGSEPAVYCNAFRQRYKVIKTIFPSDSPFRSAISAYTVDAFLFDVRYEDKQRGAALLSQAVLKEVKLLIKEGKRIIISGGLRVDNVARVLKYNPYAVDVASGIEQLVGKKDAKAMSLFIRNVKACE
jgi:phosphoribosylanthranilate isomerase